MSNKIKSRFPEAKKIGWQQLNPGTVLNDILWIIKSAARWRDLPARYGNWNSIYHKFEIDSIYLHQDSCLAQ